MSQLIGKHRGGGAQRSDPFLYSLVIGYLEGIVTHRALLPIGHCYPAVSYTH